MVSVVRFPHSEWSYINSLGEQHPRNTKMVEKNIKETNDDEEFYLVWTVNGHYIARITGVTPDYITLQTVYKLILANMIPILSNDILVVKREDIFVLYRIGSE